MGYILGVLGYIAYIAADVDFTILKEMVVIHIFHLLDSCFFL